MQKIAKQKKLAHKNVPKNWVEKLNILYNSIKKVKIFS